MASVLLAPPHLQAVGLRALWGNLTIRMDGQWFVKCKDRFGLEEAMRLNETAVHGMGAWELGYACEHLGLRPPLAPSEVAFALGWVHDHASITVRETGLEWHWVDCWNARTAEAAGVAHLGVGNLPGCRGFNNRMRAWTEWLNAHESADAHADVWTRRAECRWPQDGGCYHWLESAAPRDAAALPSSAEDDTWALMWRELGWRWFCEWAKAVYGAHGPEAARELEERVAASVGRIAAREFSALLPPPAGDLDPALQTVACLWPGTAQYDPDAHTLNLTLPDPNPWEYWARNVGSEPYADGTLPCAATYRTFHAAAITRLFPDSAPVVQYV